MKSLSELPAVDERLAEPGTRYEVEDGRRVYVPPADEPHAESHISVGAIVKAHRAGGYAVAGDMLTRTSRIDDLAPDVSLYPSARDPRTARGGADLRGRRAAPGRALSPAKAQPSCADPRWGYGGAVR